MGRASEAFGAASILRGLRRMRGVPRLSGAVQLAARVVTGEVVDQRSARVRAIRELAPGRTFAEVGGLWGTVNETVTVALQAGASEATMIDFQQPGDALWQRFDARCAAVGVSGYRCVVGDLCNDRLADDVGRFDVTVCGGVLYHAPNPVNAIRNLIAITRGRFLLTSAVVPPVISNRAGALTLQPGACLLVPALGESERAIVREHFDAYGIPATGINRPGAFAVEGQIKYGPWWWLFTADTLINMCRVFGVEIENVWHHPRSATVQARIR